MHLVLVAAHFWLFTHWMMAQDASEKKVMLQLKPCFNQELLSLDKDYNLNGEMINIETFKFYLSNVTLLNKGNPVWQEDNSYHLVDASDEVSLNIALNVSPSIKFNSIQFNLGIDSLTNVSGVMGGDLDPTKGMYWTWQSGYINFKLEGSSPSCLTRNNLFQFHLGGYMSSHSSIQTVQLKAIRDNELNVGINVAEFLEAIELSATNQIMSPGNEAQRLSELAASIFYIDE